MKKITIIPVLLLLIIYSLSAQTPVPGEILIQLEKEYELATFVKNVKGQSLVQGEFTLVKPVIADWKIYLFSFDEDLNAGEQVAELLREQEGVYTAELNFIAQERTTPDDSSYEQQWALDKLEMEKVWDVTTGGETTDGREIVVMVLDSGFDIDHSELEDNLWVNPAEIPGDGMDNDENGFDDDIHGWNFSGDTSEFTFFSNHGMGVAGIIGAKGNNAYGMAGINWDVKMMLFQGPAYSDIISAYGYAHDQRKLYNDTNGEQGAFVVASNASLGFSDRCEQRILWNDMLDSTGQVGILNVGATANANLDVDQVGDTPTGCPSDYIVTVTNTDITDTKATNAAFGNTTIDIGAPAGSSGSVRIYTLNPEESFNNDFGGCSAASPHVAGVIALMYALPCDDIAQMAMDDPAGTALLMKQSIIEGAEPNESLTGKTVSNGRLNAYRSMLWWQIYCEEGLEQEIDIDRYIDTYVSETDFISISPNPADLSATFEYSINQFRRFNVIVSDVLGRIVARLPQEAMAFSPQSFTLDTTNFAEGTYFVSIVEGSELITTKLVIIHGE